MYRKSLPPPLGKEPKPPSYLLASPTAATVIVVFVGCCGGRGCCCSCCCCCYGGCCCCCCCYGGRCCRCGGRHRRAMVGDNDNTLSADPRPVPQTACPVSGRGRTRRFGSRSQAYTVLWIAVANRRNGPTTLCAGARTRYIPARW